MITAVGDTLDKMHKYAGCAANVGGSKLGTMGTTRGKSIVNIHKGGNKTGSGLRVALNAGKGKVKRNKWRWVERKMKTTLSATRERHQMRDGQCEASSPFSALGVASPSLAASASVLAVRARMASCNLAAAVSSTGGT